ncbi:MAG: hypothetical protein AABZ12_12920 [Planctomycetota bacterium]
MDDARELQDRSQRLTQGFSTSVEPGRRTHDSAIEGGFVVGVIVSLDTENQKILWRRIRYMGRPPVAGEVEVFGAVEDGYPMETADVSLYSQFVFGYGAVDNTALPIMAVRKSGYWIIYQLFKGEPSPLTAIDPIDGCSF